MKRNFHIKCIYFFLYFYNTKLYMFAIMNRDRCPFLHRNDIEFPLHTSLHENKLRICAYFVLFL